jgi:hypothetical protein
VGLELAIAATRALRSMGRYSELVRSGFAQSVFYKESMGVQSSSPGPTKGISFLLARLWSGFPKTLTVKSRLCRKIER